MRPRRLDPIFAALRAEIDRTIVIGRVVRRTGIASHMTVRGASTALRALVERRTNPAYLFKLYAANTPDKPALVSRHGTLTYAELDARIDRVATGLRRRGIGRGTRVVLMLKNRPEFLVAHAALSRLGAASVAISWRSTATEAAWVLEHAGASFLLFDADVVDVATQTLEKTPRLLRDRFVAIGGRVRGFPAFDDFVADRVDRARDESNDGSVVIYTSGTTGKPKGAVRKFSREATPAALRFIAETPMHTDDVHLVTCPLYHATAFGFTAFAYAVGATVVLLDEFTPETFLDAVERHRVTQTAVVPTMLHRVMALGRDRIAKHDTRSLRAVFSGGAPLPGPLALEFMDAFGDVLFNFYGATETGIVTLATPADLRSSPGTIGHAVPGNEIRLLDEAGREVRAGEVGELYARNALLIEGYHDDEGATRASMRDGFFSVGDLARVDARGNFHLEGRKRDMIISGGVNVYPAEVEAALESHPAVAEVAVVGVPDADWGERVRAYVVARPGAAIDDASLRAHCRERLSGPKNPREYVFLDALPRNPTGKVLKRELRERGA